MAAVPQGLRQRLAAAPGLVTSASGIAALGKVCGTRLSAGQRSRRGR